MCHLAQEKKCILSLPPLQWSPERTRMLRYTYKTYVVNLYRTVWKWLAGSTDRTCTDQLQASALNHIVSLPVINSLQYPAIYN